MARALHPTVTPPGAYPTDDQVDDLDSALAQLRDLLAAGRYLIDELPTSSVNAAATSMASHRWRYLADKAGTAARAAERLHRDLSLIADRVERDEETRP